MQDLKVKETATEIRIELAADVLFDFDKATIKPEAATALHNVAEIIRDKGKGPCASTGTPMAREATPITRSSPSAAPRR